MQLLTLSARDIEQAVAMKEAIAANATAFERLSAGQAKVPLRLHLETPGGVTLVKPGYLEPEGALACKVVSVFPENPSRGLPTVQAVVLVLDAASGTPLALMDGTRLTALRTGAASGAATRLLAREDSRVLALFGAGGTAPDQVEAVLAVRPIEEVRIHTPSGDSARRLAGELAERHSQVKFLAASSPAQAVRGADVICCATTSRQPVFDPADLSPGTHINGVGSFTPEMREVQLRGLDNLGVWVDSLESALAEAGDIVQAMEEGVIAKDDLHELGAALAGRAPGRTSPEQTTFFKSVGTAVQDVITAKLALENARRLGLGTTVKL